MLMITCQPAYVGWILYSVNMLFVKASILIEWSRIFVPRGTRNAFFWTCQALLLCNILYYTAIIIAENLTCIPRQRIWDPTITGGKCISAKNQLVSSSVINVMSDLMILALPQKIVWKLQLSKRKKLGVSLIFAIGILYGKPIYHFSYISPYTSQS